MFKRIMVAVDLADQALSQRTISLATELGDTAGAEIRLIYVRYMVESALRYIPPSDLAAEERQSIERMMAWGKAAGIADARLSAASPLGNVYDRVLTAAEEFGADLIVIGPHTRTVSKYLLGLNASRIVQHAPMSVLVAR